MKSGLKCLLVCLLIAGIATAPYNLFPTAPQNVSASGDQDYPMTPLPSATATSAYANTVVPTAVTTYTATAMPTMTAEPSPTNLYRSTEVPTYTVTVYPTPTLTPTVTYTVTETPTQIPTEVPTYTVTVDPSPTVEMPEYTATPEPTATYTTTVVPTYTATVQPSPTITPTVVPTITATPEYTVTPGSTPSTPEPTPTPPDESDDGTMIYITPDQQNLAVGETAILEVMVDPGNSAVNGVQIHAKVDPTYLKILSVQADSSQLTTVLDAVVFDAETGVFRYGAGLINEIADSEPFTVLQLEVEALAPTEGTTVEFVLEERPLTNVTGPTGSVLGEARNGEITIQNEVILYGEIGLQGRPRGSSPAKSISVTVQAYPAGSMEIVDAFDVMLDQNGTFTYTGLMSGTYDLRLVSQHTLATKVLNVVVAGSEDEQFLGMLVEGDVVQDNAVDLEDFSILSGAYHRCDSAPDFDDRTDLDEDGCTTVADFTLLAGNYEVLGDTIYDMQNLTPLPLPEDPIAQIELQIENVANKAVGESFEVTVFVDPSGSKVRGSTAHIVFDPTLVAVTEVELLASEELPIPLQADQIDNEEGSVYFSKGNRDGSATTRFELAKLTMEIKQENDGSSLAFSSTFPATDVTGAQGSLLADESIVVGASDVEEYFLYLPVIVQ